MVKQHGNYLNKHFFGKVKKVLAPKSITMPHSVTDVFGN